MPSGVFIQVKNIGKQDAILVGNPQTTFFRSVFKRHTHFAHDNILQSIEGTIQFGNKIECKMAKGGDLLGKTHVEIDLPYVESLEGYELAWVNYIGIAMLKKIVLMIGPNVIDTHYAQWLFISNELSNKDNGYLEMIGQQTYDHSKNITTIDTTNVKNNLIGGNGSQQNKFVTSESSLQTFNKYHKSRKLYVPLNFWFCKDSGSSIPLIAIPNEDVKITIDLENIDNLLMVRNSNNGILQINPTKFLTNNSQNELSNLPNKDWITINGKYY